MVILPTESRIETDWFGCDHKHVCERSDAFAHSNCCDARAWSAGRRLPAAARVVLQALSGAGHLTGEVSRWRRR